MLDEIVTCDKDVSVKIVAVVDGDWPMMRFHVENAAGDLTNLIFMCGRKHLINECESKHLAYYVPPNILEARWSIYGIKINYIFHSHADRLLNEYLINCDGIGEPLGFMERAGVES